MHDLAKRLGDRELELRAHVYRLARRLQLGDIPRRRRRPRRGRPPRHRAAPAQWLWNVPLLRGDAGAGRRALRRGRASSPSAPGAGRPAPRSPSRPSSTPPRWPSCAGCAARRGRRRARGDSSAGCSELAEQYPAIPAWRCSLAATHAELGHEIEARAVFETLAADELRRRPPGRPVGDLARRCSPRSRPSSATPPRRGASTSMLLPYDGLNVIAGRAAASYGPVARVLGLLAATDGRLDDAERHFADALAMSERMGDRPFAARDPLRARPDAARPRPRRAIASAALELLATALDSAQEIGMVRLVQRGARGAPRGPGPGRARRQHLDRLHDRRGRRRAARHRRPRRARRAGDDPLLRHRGLDPDDRAARRRALAARSCAPTTRSSAASSPATAATRSRTRATASCSSSPTPAARSSARRRSSASSPTASRWRASGCACGWGCTPARRSARRATSSAAA